MIPAQAMSDMSARETARHAAARDLAHIDARLSALVPEATAWPGKLHAAERHALLSPGKRFRPLLCIAVARGYGVEGEAAVDAACAAEMVHAASLILDDLPCMDDADLRRDRPTTHLAYDEATAVLAATALLNRAFGVLMRLSAPAETRTELGALLSHAVGSNGLIAGQVADLANTGKTSKAEVERLNTLKTGALFDFAIMAGAVVAGADACERDELSIFSHQLGLAFQLLDDFKDIATGNTFGKTAGRDAAKSTLIALDGEAGARHRLSEYMRLAREALERTRLSSPVAIMGLLQAHMPRSVP